jgi:hypothetical protein
MRRKALERTAAFLLKENRRLCKVLERIAAGEHGGTDDDVDNNPWGVADAALGPRGTVVRCRRHDPSCSEFRTYYEGVLANGYGWYVDSKAEVVDEATSKRYPLTVIGCGAVKVRRKRFITTEQEVLKLLESCGWKLSKAMQKRKDAAT